MNRRQKKKKNTKYTYTWGYSYYEIRVYDRKKHELHIKYLHQHRKYWDKKEGV